VTDILARIFADEMGKKWGQQVIVENPRARRHRGRRQGRAPDGLHADVTSNGHTVSGLSPKTRRSIR